VSTGPKTRSDSAASACRPSRSFAGGAGHPDQVVEGALADVGALRGRHDLGGMADQRPGQPEQGGQHHRRCRSGQEHPAQPPRFRDGRLHRLAHRAERGDHLGVVQFQAF
jgi:hypothetical protein